MAYRQTRISHGWIHSMMASSVVARSFLAAVLAMIMLIPRANAQDTDICVCSPTVFNFRLDFSGTCPGNVGGDGIDETICAGDINLVPAEVISIQVLELDSNFAVIEQVFSEGPFSDGDSVFYTSISAGANLNSTFYPGGIQLNIGGQNAAGEMLLQTLIITYTNACDVWPVFLEGAAISWIQISTVRDALPQYCPDVPTTAPTDPPIAVETPAPVTAAPTASPVSDPTASPVSDPTPSPVPDPTPSPVPDPTPSPEPDPPTDMSMSFDTDNNPVRKLFAPDKDAFQDLFGMDESSDTDKDEDVFVEFGRRQQGLLRRKE